MDVLAAFPNEPVSANILLIILLPSNNRINRPVSPRATLLL